MAMALDPSLIFRARGFEADSWQRDVLLAQEREILLNCCRQAGKSTVTSPLALHTALFKPKSDALLLSPGQRQSQEIFRKVRDAYNAIERPVRCTYETQLRMELANGSRILCLPGKEATIRGYTPILIIIDEASRVPDDLYPEAAARRTSLLFRGPQERIGDSVHVPLSGRLILEEVIVFLSHGKKRALPFHPLLATALFAVLALSRPVFAGGGSRPRNKRIPRSPARAPLRPSWRSGSSMTAP